MAKNRMINTKFWDDYYISNLDPIEKLLFLYFLTNTSTNISGVYEIPLKKIAVDTGIEKDMVSKIIKRFKKDKKIFYHKGWVFIQNFIKNQNQKSPLVKIGIKNELAIVPIDILQKFKGYGYPIDTVSHSIQFNSIKPNSIQLKILSKKEFSLKEEIKKLEENKRRDLNIIALFLDYRKPDIQSYEQYSKLLKRHLKPAKELVPFSDEQIIKAIEYAKKEYTDIYTLETLFKILTK